MKVPIGWWRSFFEGAYAEEQVIEQAFKANAAEAEFIAACLKVKDGESVLDVGCGEGRHARELAARGYSVTGIDFRAAVIEEAERKARDLGAKMEFKVADMRELNLDDKYDAAYCFFGTFGYFDEDGNQQTANSIAKALKPGGRFLIDTPVLETLSYSFRPRFWTSYRDAAGIETKVLQEWTYQLEIGRADSEWTWIRNGSEIHRSLHSVQVFSYRELCQLLRNAGFTTFQGYETMTGRPFGLGCNRLTLVASLPND